LYNINAGDIGIRGGGKMDVRSLNGSWETAGLLALKSGKGTWENTGELSLYSSTGGWKTSGELKMVGSQIFFNTAGKTPTAPVAPVQPEINPPFQLYKQPNVRFDDATKRWFDGGKDGIFESVAPFTPTHEPWKRQTGKI
jgi:hypothetical protein